MVIEIHSSLYLHVQFGAWPLQYAPFSEAIHNLVSEPYVSRYPAEQEYVQVEVTSLPCEQVTCPFLGEGSVMEQLITK